MDVDFIRARITRLRMEKGVSEYQMSLDLGMSRGYIQSISSGNALPSFKQLLNICDYLDISVRDFFDENPERTKAQSEILAKLSKLDGEDLNAINHLIDHLISRHEKRAGIVS